AGPARLAGTGAGPGRYPSPAAEERGPVLSLLPRRAGTVCRPATTAPADVSRPRTVRVVGRGARHPRRRPRADRPALLPLIRRRRPDLGRRGIPVAPLARHSRD